MRAVRLFKANSSMTKGAGKERRHKAMAAASAYPTGIGQRLWVNKFEEIRAAQPLAVEFHSGVPFQAMFFHS